MNHDIDLETLLPLEPLAHAAAVAVGLLVYVLVTRIRHQRRSPASAVAWVLLIAAAPYFGTLVFLTFGTRKFARPVALASERAALELINAPVWATQTLSSLGINNPVAAERVMFDADGNAALRAILDMIAGARERLDIATYLMRDDEGGHAIAEMLLAAARRGVRVRVLLDWYGGLSASRSLLRRLRDGGIRMRKFFPSRFAPLQGTINLRNHRKVIIADGERLWSGGRNLAAEYFIDSTSHGPAWHDLSFTVEGRDPAAQAQMLFDHDWAFAHGKQVTEDPPDLRLPPPSATAITQSIPSGPDREDDTVYSLLVAAAFHAQRRMLAVTPYFVPDDSLLGAWCLAARRGVRIDLVIPVRSNHRLPDIARERSLRQLVGAGGHVHLFPAMVHAKAVVVDDALALCGTQNLDARSLFLNYESMMAFYSAPQIAWLEAWVSALVAQSRPYIAETPPLLKDLGEGIVRAVAFQL
jgi:cardiolipin synthase A/B